TKKFGRVKLYFPVKSGMRETSGKALGRVYVANTSRPEGRSPAVLHALSYQWLFVACGRGCTHWHQSGSLPSPLDAAQRSPLQSRGAVIPGLTDFGPAAAAARRAWAALAYGGGTQCGSWPPGRLWSRTMAAGRPTGMGATAQWPVISLASDVRACKGVRPSTTAPRRVRRCQLSRSASWLVSAP